MTTQKPNPVRESKLRYIGQSHILPGMSLARWHEIVLQKHGLSAIAGPNDWLTVPDSTLDAIIADIRAVLPPSPVRRGEGGEV